MAIDWAISLFYFKYAIDNDIALNTSQGTEVMENKGTLHNRRKLEVKVPD
jgi:hypothetical protein